MGSTYYRKIVASLSGPTAGTMFFGGVVMVLARVLGSLYRSSFYHNFVVYTQGYPLRSRWIFGSAINKAGFLLSVLILFAVSVVLYRRLTWSTLGPKWIRLLVMVSVGLLTWRSVTFSFNYFYGQAYLIDRLTLLGLAIVSYLHPAGLIFYLIEYFVFTAQFNLSITGASPLVNAHLVLEILFVFLAYSVVNSFRRLESSLFWFCSLLVVGTNYYHAGLQKALTSSQFWQWPFEFDLELLFARVYFRGWARAINPELARSFLSLFEDASPVLLLPVFVLELTALFICFKREVTVFQLAGLGLFHVGFYLFSGLFYWMWSFAAVVLIVVLLNLPGTETDKIYTWNRFVVSVVFILLLTEAGLVQTRSYGWWNTRYEYGFGIYAVNSRQEEYLLKRSNWGSYGPYFTLGYEYFGSFLVNETLLPTSVRVFSSRELLNRRLGEDTNSLSSLKNRYGTNNFHAGQSRQLDRFMRNIARRRINESFHPVNYLTYLAPPDFTSSAGEKGARSLSEIPGTIQKLRVKLREGIYRNHGFEERSEKVVRTISLESVPNR